MKNRVIHFEVQADNIDRAKDFYEKTFGWNVQQIMSKERGGMDYWGVITGVENTPGINGGMYERPKDKKIYTFDCTIEVENLDEVVNEIVKNGGIVTQSKSEIPGVGLFAMAEDTEGNSFGLMQPINQKDSNTI
jgi:uncharacterized protein